MITEAPQLMEYAFKTIVSIGIPIVLWILKDFKSTLKELTDNLNKLALSVTSLLEKDNSRENAIEELKTRVASIEAKLNRAERDIVRLSVKAKE